MKNTRVVLHGLRRMKYLPVHLKTITVALGYCIQK